MIEGATWIHPTPASALNGLTGSPGRLGLERESVCVCVNCHQHDFNHIGPPSLGTSLPWGGGLIRCGVVWRH